MSDLDCNFYCLIFAMQNTTNITLSVSAELYGNVNDSQNKEINGGKLNNIRPTESDIKSLNINDNIEDRYKWQRF